MQRPSSCSHTDWPCCGCGNAEMSDEAVQELLDATQGALDGLPAYEEEPELDEEPDTDDEPWDGFRSDAEADQDALNSVYGYDPEDCDTPMGDDYGGE